MIVEVMDDGSMDEVWYIGHRKSNPTINNQQSCNLLFVN